MPVYCFANDDRSIRAEELFPISDIPFALLLPGGIIACRDYGLEAKGGSRLSANWPMACEAMGVHPNQIAEAVGDARFRGVPTDFTSDGRPIFTSSHHRKRYCEAYGYYDRNGGWGDPQKRN